jgi:hypothetical protein
MDHLTWRKARKSASSGNCVEVAYGHDGHATGMVRDSKSPERGHLAVEPDAWRAFLTDVKAGHSDLSLRLVSGPREVAQCSARPSIPFRSSLQQGRPGERVPGALRADPAGGRNNYRSS